MTPNSLQVCSRQWQMGFNESKVLHMWPSNQGYEYRMKSTSFSLMKRIQESQSTRTWHFTCMYQKQCTKFLGCNIHLPRRVDIAKTVTTMMRPHLEYMNVILSPRFRRDRLKVKKIQRRASPKEERRHDSDIQDPRRHQQTRPSGILLACWHCTSHTKGHSLKLEKQRQNVFSQRVTNDWNALPAHVIDSPKLNTFKSRLDYM